MAAGRPYVADRSVVTGKDVAVQQLVALATFKVDGGDVEGDEIRPIARLDGAGSAACRLRTAAHGAVVELAAGRGFLGGEDGRHRDV
ncbi:hypothetical protein OSH11_06735 [Kaistia dalseonensis]|nr:hypothetical protein [Kaistia dalseonensis]